LLKWNTAANFLGNAWTALMALAFIPAYVHFLGVEAYGIIGLFILLQTWLSLLDLGMTPMINREVARYTAGAKSANAIRDLARSLEWITSAVALLAVFLLLSASGFIARDWVNPGKLSVGDIVNAITIMAFIIGLRFFENIYRGFLLGLQLHVQINLIGASLATVRAFGAVAVLAWASPTLHAFFLWQLFASAVHLAAIAGLAYAWRPDGDRPARFSKLELQAVKRFAGGMLGTAFVSTLLMQVDKVLLSRLLSLEDFGTYVLASTLASGITILCVPISQAWYPRLSQLHAGNDTESFTAVFHLGAQLIAVLIGSAALFLIAFAEPLLALWTQNAELAARAAPLVQLLAFGNLLNGLMFIPYQAQLAHGWTGLALRVNTIAVFVICPAIFLVTPRYGAEGAAMIWASLNLFYILIGVQLMFRRILTTEKWEWYRADILMPLLPAALVAFLMSQAMPTLPSALAQAGLLFVGGLVIFATALLGAGRVRAQVSALWRSLRTAPG
jgi:O-antigen/teichoic acid export membrane protein